jgi:hypothetical protein
MPIGRRRPLLVSVVLACLSLVSLTGGRLCLAADYATLASRVDVGRMLADINRFANLGSRVSGLDGNTRAADLILSEFNRLGLETMTQQFDLPVPADAGCRLEAGGKSYRLAALWPNLVRTSRVPTEGLTGPLLYAGACRLSDFNGKLPAGSIVLTDFNNGQGWLNAALLGAAAVIFIEPEKTTRGEAEVKFLRCPIDVPRFYIDAGSAQELIAAATLGEVKGRITARVRWENRTNRNILGILPGRNPQLRSHAMIVEAYYDSTSVAPALAPGAESACGIAALLELARNLAANPPDRSVIFLATSGHFEALAGAREFVRLWGREPGKRSERIARPRLRELTAEFDELNRQHRQVIAELHRLDLERSGRGAAARRAWWLPANRSVSAEKPMANVGQLQITPEAARVRAKRLEGDIARKQADLELWQRLDEFERIDMFISLDLSSQNASFGVFQVGWYYNQAHLLRFYSPIGKKMSEYAARACEDLGMPVDTSFVDGINPVRGREWNTFFPGKIAFDHEMAIRGGRPGLVFATVNDARDLVDTPLDTPKHVDGPNLQSQVRLLSCVLRDFLDDPTLDEDALKRVNALKKMDELKDARGTVLEFRRTESFVPNTPVPGALVMIQGQYRMMMGVHTEVMGIANETSEFTLRGERASGGVLEAYGLDPDDGSITFAPDLGPDGDRKYPRDVYGRAGLKRPLIVFRCVPTDLYDLVDERYFQTLQRIFVYDAKDYSEPVSFGYALSSAAGAAAEFPSYVEPCAVIFSQPQVDLQVTMGMGLLGVRMALINATPDKPEGIGYPASETRRIPLTPLQVGRDMWRLDESRMDKLRKNGIDNARLRELHDLAKASLEKAVTSLSERRYDAAMSAGRHAWGYESRAYPEVQKTAVDVVKGLLFYLAILLPFSYFGERLLFAGRNILYQILGTVGVFVGVFLMIAAVHPAFSMTTSPPVILLSFIIMALAVAVIAIVTLKFNTELKSMKQQQGGVHEADVGRLSAAGAAFALGIANMRRRKTRTALTAITLTLLTFTVLSFTSVKSFLRANKVRLSQAPAYQGVMLRDRSWLSLEEPIADIISNELRGRALVAPRAWYVSPDLEKELVIDIALSTDPATRYSVNCLLGMSPEASEVLPVRKALVAGQWFRKDARNVALLPTAVAEALGITADRLGSASVNVFGTDFRVIGLVDSGALRQLTDLDGEPLMPVNYSMLRPETIKDIQQAAQERSQLGAGGAESLLQEYKHYSPEKLIILPYDRVLELGGTLRAISVRFNDPSEVPESVDQMMKRFALSLYTGMGKDSYLFSSVGMTSVAGAESLVIPILIAALIVLNTMLGSVYERTKEIGIYSSLGLAPSHISMLFLAEAAVFANLGAIVGYLLGQALAKVIYLTGAHVGLELNYSSLTAVGVTIVIVVVVLLSTIYPSRRAADIASPGIERRWSLPAPQGDVMDLLLPFTVTGRDAYGVCAFLKEFFDEYVGYAGGEFLAEDVRLEPLRNHATKADEITGMTVKLRMWLAPYDLGVSQDFLLECRPTEDPGVYSVHIKLTHLAGDLTSWKKTNSLFMAAIRKQFLIWRTVPQDEKLEYADRAEKILRGEWAHQADLI